MLPLPLWYAGCIQERYVPKTGLIYMCGNALVPGILFCDAGIRVFSVCLLKYLYDADGRQVSEQEEESEV
jgi:hypothetical protein